MVERMIEAARRVTGVQIGFERAPRRAGDPSVLVASSAKARSAMGWVPEYTDVAAIIESAWRWHLPPRY